MRILIVAPNWVGDAVMTQSLLLALKENHPDCIIDILSPKFLCPLFQKMPQVHEILPSSFTHGKLQLIKRLKFARNLKNKHYAQAIILPNSLKSALIPFFAKIKKRTGWRGEFRYGLLNDIKKLDEKKHPLMIQRFVALAYVKNTDFVIQKPFLTPDINSAYKYLHNINKENLFFHNNTLQKKVLVLCPGSAYGSAKRWPIDYFAEIANKKLDEGWQVWLFGSTEDIEITEKINVKASNRCLNLAGKTNLNDAIDLLALAEIIISNDSGLLHIASALNKKLIAIFGSSSYKFTPPLADNCKIISLNLPCSPCFARVCPLKHFRCMIDLKPNIILQAYKELEGQNNNI